MLVHHLLTKGVLIASTALVWTASAIMNLPYLIAVQYIELNNPENGEKYGVSWTFVFGTPLKSGYSRSRRECSESGNLVYIHFETREFTQFEKFHTSQFQICTRRFLVMGDINVLQVVTTINLIVWYAGPLIILLVIYVTIGFVLFRSTDRNSVTRSSQATITPRSKLLTSEFPSFFRWILKTWFQKTQLIVPKIKQIWKRWILGSA